MRERLHRQEPFDYQTTRDNREWKEHVARSFVTAGLIAWLNPGSILDPACGDGSIVALADRLSPIKRIVLGDISALNCDLATVRTLSDRVINEDIASILALDGRYDVIVLTEILEHLEDPDAIVRLAREKGNALVASSPIMRPGQQDVNPEHLWQFDAEGYREMLSDLGWSPIQETHLLFPSDYDFTIVVCR